MKNPILTGLAVFFFILSLSVFIFCWQLKVLSKPTFFAEIIESSNLYENLPQLADHLKVNESTNFNFVAVIKAMSVVVDKPLAEQTFNPAIISLTNYMTAKTDQLNIVLDLTQIKEKFFSQWKTLAPEIFVTEYNKLPVCPENKKISLSQFTSGNITCQSPSFSSENLTQLVQTADTSGLVQAIPDKADVSTAFQKNKSLEHLRKIFKALYIAYPLSFIILILSLALILVALAQDAKALAKTIGWPLFLVSFPIVVLNLAAFESTNVLKALTANSLSAQIATIIAPFLDAMVRSIMIATIGLPLVLSIGGVILLIVAIFIPKQEPKIIPPGFDK